MANSLLDILNRFRGKSSGSGSGELNTQAQLGRNIGPGGGANAVLEDLRGRANRVYNWSNDPEYERLGEVRRTASGQALAFAEEGQRLASGEDAAQQRALSFLQDRYSELSAPRDYEGSRQALFANQTDRLAEGTLGDMDFLTTYLGNSGRVLDQGTAALAAQVKRSQDAGVTSALNDLEMWQTEMETQDLLRNWQAGTTVAGAMAQGPSDAWIQTLGSLLGVSLTQESNEQGVISAQQQARAIERAADKDFWSQIAGAGIGGAFSLAGLAL